MKKFVTVGIVTILTGVLLSGCSWFQPPQEEVMDDQKDETEDTQVMEEPYTYENTNYGFALTFLASWGKVDEKVEVGNDPFTAKIDLTSEDGDKKLKLFVVANEATGDAYVVDFPAEKIGETAKYTVYRSVDQGIDILEGQGEDMTKEKAVRDEIIEIAGTFVAIGEVAKDPSLYENTKYGFSLQFPITWGEHKAHEIPGDEIIVSTPFDADRNFSIILVGVDYKDTIKDIEGSEHIYMGENDELAFYARVQYCHGGPDCDEEKQDMVGEEVEDIAETFELLKTKDLTKEMMVENEILLGKYFTNSYYGGMMLFTPESGAENTIIFTNQEESYKMLGLEEGELLDGECSDYSGKATVKITNRVKNEEQTHTPPYSAELVDVPTYAFPTCDI